MVGYRAVIAIPPEKIGGEVGADEDDLAIARQGEERVRHRGAVLDGGHARVDGVARARFRDAMGGDLQADAPGLVHRGADVVPRIDVGLVVHHELDDAGAEVDVLPHRLADLVLRVGVDVLGDAQIAPLRL